MKVPFLDLNLINSVFLPEIRDGFDRVFAKSNYILGEEVEEFERNFAEYCNVNHCIGVSSGTEALHLALRSLDIGPGDEVITVANTFIATVLAISYVGATPVLVDCDPINYNINPLLIEEKITSKTKAIIPVHLYGQVCEIDKIKSIAKKYNLAVVEDASQAHGALFKGEKVGSIGDIGCFSFYPGKNLGAFGDAGGLVTNTVKHNEKLMMLRNYGSPKKYYHEFIGYNSRLDTLQAIVLNEKLKQLDSFNIKRIAAAERYSKNLKEYNNVVTPEFKSDCSHVFHLYVIQVNNRDEVISSLAQHGIQTVIHYPNPIYRLKAYTELAITSDKLPITEMLSQRILSLPLFPGMTNEQIDYVCETIVKVAK